MLPALGFIEIPFLSIAAIVADTVTKAARISILGFEATGNENILIRIGGGVSDIGVALATADETAARLRSPAVVHSVLRPAEAMQAMIISQMRKIRFSADATSCCQPIFRNLKPRL